VQLVIEISSSSSLFLPFTFDLIGYYSLDFQYARVCLIFELLFI
jgi:hypothetical protein